MPPLGLRRRLSRALSCEQAEESLSAMVDQERPPVSPRRLRAHLAGCPSCAAFAAGCQDLAGRLEPVPPLHLASPGTRREHLEETVRAVRGALATSEEGPPDPDRAWPAAPARWRPRAAAGRHWLLAAFPAAAVAIALPLGAWAAFHVPPAHRQLCHAQPALLVAPYSGAQAGQGGP